MAMLWWLDQLGEWAENRQPVTMCPALTKETEKLPAPGYVPCEPKKLCADAARVMEWDEMPIDIYSAARLIAGPKTVPEKAALIEIAQNSAIRHRCSFSENLLYNKHGLKLFGNHTQKRRFPTTHDPTVGDVQIASFVLSGMTAGYANGGDMVVVPSAGLDQAIKQGVWVGNIEEISPKRMLVFKKKSTVYPDDIKKNQEAIKALSAPEEQTDWKDGVAPLAAVLAISSAFAAGTSYAMAEFNSRRWKDWR